MKKLLIIPVLFWVFMSSQALGTPVNFGDNTYFWAGWNSQAADGALDDSRDEIGTPIFPGTPIAPGSSAGSYNINGSGKLTRITFNYNLVGSSQNTAEPYVKPGDLFIDKNGDGTWDYLVQVYNQTAAFNYNLYSITLSSLGGTVGYILSDAAWLASGYPGGADIRNDHPVAIDSTVLKSSLGTAYFDGWNTSGLAGNYTTYFDFGSSGLDIGNTFQFAWTVNCANDVIREQGSNSAVPEPATMLLLGSGLIGFGAFARKKFKK